MTKKIVNVEAGVVEFRFDDESIETFDMAKCNAETQERLKFHGASQKIGDSYAGASESADPLAYAKAAVKETIAQLYAGDWRVTSAGGPRVSDLAVALSRINGDTVEANAQKLAAANDEQKKLLRKQPQVAAMLASIDLEKRTIKAAKLAEAAKAGPQLVF